MALYANTVWWHPLRAWQIFWRKLILNRNYGDPVWDGGAIPAILTPFAEGELWPIKGVQFRVAKIVGGDQPCIIVVPVDRTRGAKLTTLRRYRDLARRVAKGR